MYLGNYMWILKRNCPNCKSNVPIKERKKLIINSKIKCTNCNQVLQPTILWTVIICALLALIFKSLVYSSFKEIFGINIAVGGVLILVFIFARLLDSLSDLKAHDEDDFL